MNDNSYTMYWRSGVLTSYTRNRMMVAEERELLFNAYQV